VRDDRRKRAPERANDRRQDDVGCGCEKCDSEFAGFTAADPPRVRQYAFVLGEQVRQLLLQGLAAAVSRTSVGGLRFTALDFGPCESVSETVWMLGDGDSAFVGDLAFNGTHAYLADGHTGAWLEALDRAEEVLAGVRVLYLGHGPSATPAVLAEQRRYLLMVREAIGRVAGGRAELSEEEANEVAGLIDRFLHGAPLAWLVSVGAPAVAAELARTPARA
jgi:glyoxylase-like metal-dependent hydrolase (beta-lactamase superfamily II)